MADVEGETSRWQYRRSVRDHVREPLRAAADRLERERTELHDERVAFERFAEKVTAIAPPATSGGPTVLAEDHTQAKRAAVRDAYRETVLAVDHYDRVYDESLLENAASELGTDVAEGFRDGAGLAFTEHAQSMIHTAALDAAARRSEFEECIVDERESIQDARDHLREIVKSLDGSGLPSWYRPAFDDELDDLAARRQERLQSRSGYRRDGHDLCAYVYADEEWTYPVLTAVARLRNSVV